jgi:hypothetical protein
MGKKAPIKKVETNAGNTYTKERGPNGNIRFRKNGKFASAKQWNAGAGEVTKGYGEVQAENQRWEPDLTVEAPVPDGEGGVEYEQVRWDKASQLGQMANDSSIRESITVNGEEYSQEQIEEAFGSATPKDGQAVRY